MSAVILDRLAKFGEVSKTGSLVYVAIPVISKPARIETLDAIQSDLKSGGIAVSIHHDRPDYSSIGYALAENLKIMVKSTRQQGAFSPGLTNESFLVSQIDKYLAVSKTLTLQFFASTSGRVLSIDRVVRCVATKNKRTERGKNKVDVVFCTDEGKNLNFSIKKAGAERWQSADTYYGRLARLRLDRAVSGGLTRYTMALGLDGMPIYRGGNRDTPIVRLEPELFWRMPDEEKLHVCYGKDVDYVVKGDFEADSRVHMLDGGILRVDCSDIYERGQIICGPDEPCWMIRNDASRNCLPLGISGLRVEAVCKSRTVYGVEVSDVN
jgi:hypothetical protein